MAKIRNVFINCNSADVKKSFEVTIVYSAKEKRFEISLPDELKAIAINFDHQEVYQMGIKHIPKFSDNKIHDSYFIIGDTEALIEEKATEVFKHLNSLQVQRRPVIVIDLSQYDNRHYRDQYNPEQPKIGIDLGLLYCMETRAGNAKPSYTLTKTYSGISGDEFRNVHHKEISSHCVIIDDTPRNRAFLENIYALLNKLIADLTTHLKTPETILQLIASGQKLLG